MTYDHAQQEGNAAGTSLNIVINFNDCYGSFMCLTCLLISNNWNSMVDLYCLVYDYPNESTWPRLYFSIFFFLVALIILNIIISFVLELYDVVGDDVEDQFTREKNLETLALANLTKDELVRVIEKMNEEERQVASESGNQNDLLVSPLNVWHP